MQKLSNVKRMDIWTAVRTVLEKSPGLQAKHLIREVREKTGLGRSTIYDHLGSFTLKGNISREKGKYWLSEQKRVTDQIQRVYPTPKIHFEITQQIYNHPQLRRQLPNVGFNMFNLNDYPIRVKVEARTILGGRNLGLIQDAEGYYSGGTEWLLEPVGMVGAGIKNGNFSIPKECVNSTEKLTIEIRTTITDQYDREHELWPKGWTYVRKENAWYFEPKAFTKARAKRRSC